MKILLLGGTKFLGRHLVDAALASGHELTTFTRGAHDEVLPEGVERLRGNRDGDLSALEGRRWDAVIDTSGYVPRIVRASAEQLVGNVDRYVFISTISVYPDHTTVGITEEEPVGTLADPTVEDPTGEAYGPLKALCEDEVRHFFGPSAFIVRPGLIVGPYDPTNRFTYWPHRVAAGGEVLAPGRPGLPVQFIDARDLADWTLRLVQDGQGRTYNATGPDRALTMGEVLETARDVSGADAHFTWVDDAFLQREGVGPWMELPLWLPEAEAPGFSTVNCARALAAGLTFRPLAETVRDTLAWRATQPQDATWPAGLKREREAELLAAWHAEHERGT